MAACEDSREAKSACPLQGHVLSEAMLEKAASKTKEAEQQHSSAAVSSQPIQPWDRLRPPGLYRRLKQMTYPFTRPHLRPPPRESPLAPREPPLLPRPP